MLLREVMNFAKSNTKRGWEKLPNGQKNKPEYAEHAILETTPDVGDIVDKLAYH